MTAARAFRTRLGVTVTKPNNVVHTTFPETPWTRFVSSVVDIGTGVHVGENLDFLRALLTGKVISVLSQAGETMRGFSVFNSHTT